MPTLTPTMSTTKPAVIDEVRTAYADAGDQREDPKYSRGMRCLGFLASEWVDAERARELLAVIGPYNAFEPGTVADILDSVVENADPDARFAIGREGSPVIYVETSEPEHVIDISGRSWPNGDDAPFGDASPDELNEVPADSVGSARKYTNNDLGLEAHSMCAHDRPPVETEDLAPTDLDNQYVRAWWD